jgi:hypothetical protein
MKLPSSYLPVRPDPSWAQAYLIASASAVAGSVLAGMQEQYALHGLTHSLVLVEEALHCFLVALVVLAEVSQPVEVPVDLVARQVAVLAAAVVVVVAAVIVGLGAAATSPVLYRLAGL